MNEVVSADEIKKSIRGYNPKKSEEFHSESAKLADKEFYEKIKGNPNKEVILICGGSASGKTEYLTTYLSHFKGVILDTTLSTKEGARIKIEKILKQKKKPRIVAVIPDDLRRAFLAFLSRDRQYPDKYFYETHAGSKETLLWIAQKHPDIEIDYFISTYGKSKKIRFGKAEIKDKIMEIEFLKENLYNVFQFKQLNRNENSTTTASQS